MPMADSQPPESPSIVVEDLAVTYRVYEDRQPQLRKLMTRDFRSRRFREVQAVRGISCTAYAGEAIGIVGVNGSGKSTFLRAVAGLLPAVRGAVYARTNPVLLGVGAALQADLSGRRNIVIGGTALGMSRETVEERAESIIQFAGLEDFIDMPFRAYSSGMKARLQFAIATAVQPEILLIDEALAVGDQQFQQRSQERLHELLGQASTVFIVSHSLKSLRELCSRALWIDQGVLLMDGEAEEVIAKYESDSRPMR